MQYTGINCGRCPPEHGISRQSQSIIATAQGGEVFTPETVDLPTGSRVKLRLRCGQRRKSRCQSGASTCSVEFLRARTNILGA